MRISRFSIHVKISSSIIASMRTRFTLIEENEARQWYNSSTISTFSETFENGLLSTSWSNSFHWKMALFAWFGRRHQSVPVAMQMSAHPRRGIRGRLRRGDFILRDVPKHRRGAKRMHSHADVRYLLVRKGENSRGESSTRWKYPRYEFSFRYSLLSLRNNRGMKEKKKKRNLFSSKIFRRDFTSQRVSTNNIGWCIIIAALFFFKNCCVSFNSFTEIILSLFEKGWNTRTFWRRNNQQVERFVREVQIEPSTLPFVNCSFCSKMANMHIQKRQDYFYERKKEKIKGNANF